MVRSLPPANGLSPPAEANVLPSGEKTTAATRPTCPWSWRSGFPVARSQRYKLSTKRDWERRAANPPATVLASGERANAFTSIGPAGDTWIRLRSLPALTSQSAIHPLREALAAATAPPSLETATERVDGPPAKKWARSLPVASSQVRNHPRGPPTARNF